MKDREIAEFVGGELSGNGDVELSSVADINLAQSGQISFLEKAGDTIETSASCVLVPRGSTYAGTSTLIKVANPKLAFAQVASLLHPAKIRDPEIHPTAVISKTATLSQNVFVGAFVCVGDASTVGDGTQLRAGAKIGDNVTVGANCVLHPNVFIEDGCTVGDNVILHPGVVIGADGFGYVKDAPTTPSPHHPATTPSPEAGATPPKTGGELNPATPPKTGGESASAPLLKPGGELNPATPPQAGGEYIKFPQIGTVVIEDDVEIGPNTCVDRGALGETRIGAGTKIDNLVQVGHNVQIGKRCVIAAQTGISGSTVIEDDCVIGGQVGFGDHAHVKSGAIIGSQAGVLPGKIVRPGVWWGTPIQPLEEYKRQNAHVKGLERLKTQVKELKARLDETSPDKNA